MLGAESLLKTLINSGVEVCFANPGTSEMHFVAALDRVDGMRCVLGLQELVVTGAADGYSRMAGKPAATLLHLGPGLANGLANLHNARRGHGRIVNIIGEHAIYHVELDSPLTSDIESLAKPMSHWVKTAKFVEELPVLAAEAVAVANSGNGKIASLILPANLSWSEDGPEPAAPNTNDYSQADGAGFEVAVEALTSGEPATLFLGGTELTAEILELGGKIASKTGAKLMCEVFPGRIAHGAGVASVMKLPYFTEMARPMMGAYKQVVLAGAVSPVSFFAYPGQPSHLVSEDVNITILAEPDQDIHRALAALADALGANDEEPPRNVARNVDMPEGPLTPATAARAVAALLPEGAVVLDEGITCGMDMWAALATAKPHEWLIQAGGAICWGLSAAVGAAVAVPDRKIVCLEGDGSGMMNIQALWTMAREKLDVTTILFANRSYAILQFEYARVGAEGMGENAKSMMSMDDPTIDFVGIAKSMGVHGIRATTAEEFTAAFRDCMTTPGPHLIEAVM